MLFHLEAQGNLSPQNQKHYLALHATEVLTDEILQSMTPHVMRWDETTWLMDLGSCWSYWQKQARQQNLEVPLLLRQVLERFLGEQDYVAALGHSPWSCLLLAEDMRQKNIQGFVDLGNRMTQNLVSNMSWESWMHTAERCGFHFELAQFKRFRKQSFQSNLKCLQRTLERLGFDKVSDLQGTDAYAMKRRFGSVIKVLWQWTQGEQTAMNERLYEFPWVSHAFRTEPQVVRHLEHAVTEWEQLEPLLCEDFNRLCALPQWGAQDKVLRLEWRLVLHDLTTLNVPITFRHPHSLHHDSPCQKTASLQAYYRFTEVVQEFAQSKEETDELAKPLVISWSVRVCETLRMPAQVIDIFGERSSEELALNHLENRLLVPLKSFDLQNDHAPEDSYAESSGEKGAAVLPPLSKEDGSEDPHQHIRKDLLLSAQHRPLFIYSKPRAMRARRVSAAWRFCERTMNKWWQDEPGDASLFRDYYRMVDERNRVLWVFKDSSGRWFIHGIFA